MRDKGRILFIMPRIAPFIERDKEILSGCFSLRIVNADLRNGGIKRYISFALELIKGTIWTDIVYCWFGGVHAFPAVLLSKMIRRRSIVIVGGYEVAKSKEYGYGAASQTWRGLLTRFALDNADRVAVVDPSLIEDAKRNLDISAKNFIWIPTGYDPDRFVIGNCQKDVVLAVATAVTDTDVNIKGIRTFIEAARLLPDLKFVLIGPSSKIKEELNRDSPKNIEIIARIPQDELIGHYQKAKVYCQLSLMEGLPNAVCEAMLCGCNVVGTDCVPGNKTALGDLGVFVPFNDPRATAEAIMKAFKRDADVELRKRAIDNFSIDRRKKAIVDLVCSQLQ